MLKKMPLLFFKAQHGIIKKLNQLMIEATSDYI